jgi:hypothetical protein
VDDSELDDFLMQRLADVPVEDEGFTDRLRQRLRSRRRRRRTALVAAAITAAIPAASVGTVDLSLATVPEMFAVMMLVAVCAVVWIATESGEARLAP